MVGLTGPVERSRAGAQAVATVLGIRELSPGLPLMAVSRTILRAKDLLLVTDNCEHLLGACAQLIGRC